MVFNKMIFYNLSNRLLTFALFISPLADLTTPTMYSNDNYLFNSGGKTEKKALENLSKRQKL